MEIASDSVELAAEKPLQGRAKRRHVRARPQLLTRNELDGRSNAAKTFDRLVSEIETDLGGRDQLSAIERTLIEAYAGAYVSLCNLSMRLALGEQIDLSEHSAAVGAMVRVASRLGLQRRARDVTSPPSVAEYLEHINGEAAK
jgi:hypothetical protein